MDTHGKKLKVSRISLDISGFVESRLREDAAAEGVRPGHIAKRIIHRYYRNKPQ